MQTLIYKSDTEGVTPIGNRNPLPVSSSAYDDALSFNSNFVTNDATETLTVKAGESGKSIYVTDITLSASAANRIDIKDSDNNVLSTIFLGANAPYVKKYATHLKVPAGKDLRIKSATGVNLAVDICGLIR